MHARARRWLSELPHLALGLVLLEWLLRRVWLRGEVALGSDVGLFAIPRFQLLSELWRAGELPGWNPWFGCGAPLYGDLSFAALYPGNALLWVLEPLDALGVYLMGHLALGYVGAYVALRERSTGRHASAIAALGFGVGGLALGQIQTPIYVAATAWLPWCVLGFTRWARAPSGPRLLVAALPFALTFLAGAPENCLSAGLVAVCASRGVTGRGWGELLARLAAVGALAAVVCGALLVPALLVIADSTRAAGLSPGEAGRWSLSPLQLAQLVAPLRVGHGALPVEVLASDYRPWHACLYAGAAPLAGALLGVRQAWSARRPELWGALALLVVACGSYTPVYGVLSELPGLRAFRYPAKLWVPCWFLLTLLAGPALDAARAATLGKLFAGLTLAAAVLGGAALFGGAGLGAAVGGLAAAGGWACCRTRRPRRWLLALTLCDLALGGSLVVETGPRALFAEPELARAVAAETLRAGHPQRTGTLATSLRVGLDLEDVGRTASEQHSWREALLPNAGAPFGVRTVAGFSSILLARPRALHAAGSAAGLSELELNTLLGAELVVYTLADVAQVGSAVAPLADAGLWRLGRAREARPWAAVYAHPRYVDSREAACAARLAAGREEAVLEAPGPAGSGPPARVAARVRLVHEAPDLLELDVESAAAGVLVLREAYAPGWSAEVDGEPVPVSPADVMFRGVPVDPGRQRVRLRYRVPGWSAGLAASGLGLLLCLAIGLGGRPRR